MVHRSWCNQWVIDCTLSVVNEAQPAIKTWWWWWWWDWWGWWARVRLLVYPYSECGWLTGVCAMELKTWTSSSHPKPRQKTCRESTSLAGALSAN
jgi:hypothetical protein